MSKYPLTISNSKDGEVIEMGNISDLDLSDELRKGLVSMAFIEDFLRAYLDTETYKDSSYRAAILTYETGDVVKHLVYKKAYGGQRWNKDEVGLALEQVVVNAMLTGIACHVDVIAGMGNALEQMKHREWRKK